MFDSIRQILAPVPDTATKAALDTLIGYLADRLNSVSLSNAGLVIKAGSSALIKNGTAWYGIADGKLITKAANTDMAALSGTVANATFNVFAFFVTSAGTLSTVMGTAATTLAGVKVPQKPTGSALIGYVIINPTGTGDFVGGTTAIDDGTVVPGALYINVIGAADSTFLLTK
jgi:hypothetical protein